MSFVLVPRLSQFTVSYLVVNLGFTENVLRLQ